MGKTTDTFRRLNFWLPQNPRRVTSAELLMQVSDFKVNYRLKKLKGIRMESMECLNKDAKKKKKKKKKMMKGMPHVHSCT